MTDDIVTQLRESEWNENPQTNVRLCAEAADEIERLRGICDMLANRLRSGSDSGWDDAIDAWEDVSEFGNDPESQGSAKLSPNSETNVDDTIPSDIVKEYAEYLYDLAFNAHLTQADHETLKHAARLLLNLQRSIGIKDGMLKSWDFMLNQARDQAQEAHAIVSSDAMVWLVGENSEHQQHYWDHLMPYIKQYWEKYGTIMRPHQSS